MLLCQEDADAAVTTAAEWIRAAPDLDVRLGGYIRDTLRRVDAVPAPICHVGGVGATVVDRELVRDHLSPRLVHAVADCSLERAAGELTHGRFRDVPSAQAVRA